jgi:hypothetical protein
MSGPKSAHQKMSSLRKCVCWENATAPNYVGWENVLKWLKVRPNKSTTISIIKVKIVVASKPSSIFWKLSDNNVGFKFLTQFQDILKERCSAEKKSDHLSFKIHWRVLVIILGITKRVVWRLFTLYVCFTVQK